MRSSVPSSSGNLWTKHVSLQGPSQFVTVLSGIASSLQELRSEPGPQGIFVHRLLFAIRYAEFHQRNLIGETENAALDLVSMFEEDLAPRSWWGVLLHDVTPFIQNGAWAESFHVSGG